MVQVPSFPPILQEYFYLACNHGIKIDYRNKFYNLNTQINDSMLLALQLSALNCNLIY
jgi:hypothetical protein